MRFRELFSAGPILLLALTGLMLPSAAESRGPMDVAAITIEPAAGLPFGDSAIDSYSLSRTVGIRSAGITDLEISRIGFAGSDASEFALDTPSPCPPRLLATSSCSFPVYFAPKTLGPKTALLEVESNALEGTVSIPLTGTGIPPVAEPVAAPRAFFTKKPRPVVRIERSSPKSLKVAFASDQAGAGFRCSTDGKAFKSCSSPAILRNLKPGKHRFAVKAERGGKSGLAAVANFRVVRQK